MEIQEMETAATVRVINIKKLFVRSNAQRQKEYRERKKIEKRLKQLPKNLPKTNAERQQQYRLNQKALQTLQSEKSILAKKRKDAERAKRYRDKLKYKNLCASSLPTLKEDSLSTLIINNISQCQTQTSNIQPAVNNEAKQVIGPSYLSFPVPCVEQESRLETNIDGDNNDPLAIDMTTPSSTFVKCEPEFHSDYNTVVKTEPDIQEAPQQLKLTSEIKLENDPECDVTSNTLGCRIKTEPVDTDDNEQESPQPSIENVEVKCEFEDTEYNLPLPSSFLEQQMTVNTEPIREEQEGGAPKSEAKKRKSAKDKSSNKKQPPIEARTVFGAQTSENEKHFQCEECKKLYKTRSRFLRHIRTHTGEKPNCDKTFQCDICHKTFNKKSNLFTHSRTHTGEKPFQCEVCQRAFREKGTLSRHIRMHTGEKPNSDKTFQCDVCYKTFNKKSNLLTHRRTHTGEKPFQCVVCHRAFREKGTLSRHIRIHTGEKPFHCEVCQRDFINKYSLTKHMRTHSCEKAYTDE